MSHIYQVKDVVSIVFLHLFRPHVRMVVAMKPTMKTNRYTDQSQSENVFTSYFQIMSTALLILLSVLSADVLSASGGV